VKVLPFISSDIVQQIKKNGHRVRNKNKSKSFAITEIAWQLGGSIELGHCRISQTVVSAKNKSEKYNYSKQMNNMNRS